MRQNNQFLALFRSIDPTRLGKANTTKLTAAQIAYRKSLFEENGVFDQIKLHLKKTSRKTYDTLNQDAVLDDSIDYVAENEHVCQQDAETAALLDPWFTQAKASYKALSNDQQQIHKNIFPTYKHEKTLVTLISIFTIRLTIEMQQRSLTEIIAVFERLGDEVNSLKEIQLRHNQLVEEKKVFNKDREKELLKKLKVSTFDELMIAADLRLASKLANNHFTATTKTANSDVELSLLESTSTPYLDELSQLADELIEEADDREDVFPEDRVLAAHIRFTINQQKIIPVSNPEFIQKLTPLLHQAEINFARHHQGTLMRIVKAILKIVTGIPGIISAAKECYHYTKTGHVRLFHPRALKIIDKLKAYADRIPTRNFS